MSKFKTASAMLQEWEESSKRMQTEAKIRADERKKVLDEVITKAHCSHNGKVNGCENDCEDCGAYIVEKWEIEQMKGEPA